MSEAVGSVSATDPKDYPGRLKPTINNSTDTNVQENSEQKSLSQSSQISANERFDLSHRRAVAAQEEGAESDDVKSEDKDWELIGAIKKISRLNEGGIQGKVRGGSRTEKWKDGIKRETTWTNTTDLSRPGEQYKYLEVGSPKLEKPSNLDPALEPHFRELSLYLGEYRENLNPEQIGEMLNKAYGKTKDIFDPDNPFYALQIAEAAVNPHIPKEVMATFNEDYQFLSGLYPEGLRADIYDESVPMRDIRGDDDDLPGAEDMSFFNERHNELVASTSKLNELIRDLKIDAQDFKSKNGKQGLDIYSMAHPRAYVQSYRDLGLVASDEKTQALIEDFKEKYGEKPSVTFSIYHANDKDLDFNHAMDSVARGLLESHQSDLKYRGLSTTDGKPVMHMAFVSQGSEANFTNLNSELASWAKRNGLEINFAAEYLDAHGNPDGLVVDDEPGVSELNRINTEDKDDLSKLGELFSAADEIYFCSRGCSNGKDFTSAAAGAINKGVRAAGGDADVRAESSYYLAWSSSNQPFRGLPQFKLTDSGASTVSIAYRNIYPKGGNVSITMKTVE